jgi:hypothetical protein
MEFTEIYFLLCFLSVFRCCAGRTGRCRTAFGVLSVCCLVSYTYPWSPFYEVVRLTLYQIIRLYYVQVTEGPLFFIFQHKTAYRAAHNASVQHPVLWREKLEDREN